MMDMHMWDKGAKAGKNVIEEILEYLEKEEKIKISQSIRWIGFEGTPGTKFTLNNQKTEMQIPKGGSWVSPFDGDKFMSINSLKFSKDFNENIYYIY